MAKQTINLGVAPDGAGGDSVRSGFTKVNSNFDEVYDNVTSIQDNVTSIQDNVTSIQDNVTSIQEDVTSIQERVVPIELGGTGGTTAEEARQGLGLGSAATKDVGFDEGYLMESRQTLPVGTLNWSSGFYAVGSESISGIPDYHSVIVAPYALESQGWSGTILGFRLGDGEMSITQVRYSSIHPRRIVRDSVNTTVDGSGFIKSASPIIKLSSTSLSTNEDPHFTDNKPTLTKQSNGVYTITNTHGLRLGDGWYIEQPRDRNGNIYHNVEWEQDIEYTPKDGIVEENDPTVILTIKTFERVWNKDTGVWENGNPVDIKEGRWIDLRLNEIRQPDPIIEHSDNEDKEEL